MSLRLLRGGKKSIKRVLNMFSTEKPLSKPLYVVGVIVIFAAVYVQYFVDLGPIVGYLVVYGVPIAVASLFFGREVLRRAAKNNATAAELGMGLFGALTLLGLFIAVAVLMVILQFDPNASNLLNKPNPVLNVPPSEAWILIAVSFLVVGPAEEFLFRGFMFGGLLSIFKGKRWILLSVVSSLMFALVHAYYAVTYGVASAVPFIELVAFGVAMCITYYWSEGNILIPALIHGAYDATGFLGVATTSTIGLAARVALIAAGLVCAVIFLPRKIRMRPTSPEDTSQAPLPSPPQPEGNPDSTALA